MLLHISTKQGTSLQSKIAHWATVVIELWQLALSCWSTFSFLLYLLVVWDQDFFKHLFVVKIPFLDVDYTKKCCSIQIHQDWSAFHLCIAILQMKVIFEEHLPTSVWLHSGIYEKTVSASKKITCQDINRRFQYSLYMMFV